jgi:hypothetical protein
MNPPEEDDRLREDNDLREKDLDLGPFPADEDVEEGDEEKGVETDLPPAMPPGA